jgi:hypothetical protein
MKYNEAVEFLIFKKAQPFFKFINQIKQQVKILKILWIYKNRVILQPIVVERPVTKPTPHRSGHAELPHPALQLYIHSCKTRL